MTIDTQQISKDVLIEKYCKNGETTVEDVYKRVAKGVSKAESPEKQQEWEDTFYKNMQEGAIGAGRIMSAAGSDIQATLINCFSGETKALTSEGYKELKELVGKTIKVFSIDGWRDATFKNFDKQKLYKITFAGNRIHYATLDHRWLSTGAIPMITKADDLKETTTKDLVGQYIPAVGHIPELNVDISINYLKRLGFIKVLSVEETDREEDVYCAVEPVTQTFTIEGNIITRNCFVEPIGDSIKDLDAEGNPGIYTALLESAETMKRGGGVGYNFSHIRPKNAFVKSVGSFSSGPCSYIDIFNTSCATIESAGCFHGDTLISTTEGLIKISEIVNSPEIKEWYVNTHIGPRKVTTKFKNGIKPIWNVTTNYGYNVRVTKDHKFAQFENGAIVTKRIEDIYFSNNKDLLILIPNGVDLTPSWSESEMTAYLVGAFQGNGTWCYNQTSVEGVKVISGISISNNTTKEHITDKIVDFATRLGLNPKKSKRPNENTLDIVIYNTVYFRNWKDIGVNKGMEMHIPSFILQGTDNDRAAYVAGMMEADGCISETKSNTRLRLVTKELLKDIQVILSTFGVPATLKLERMAIEEWKDIYCLGIYGPVAQKRFNDTVGKFMLITLNNLATRDRVGYGHPWKEVRQFGVRHYQIENYWSGVERTHPNISLNALVNTVSVPELINTVTDRIRTITIEDPVETYDIEVEDVHLLSGDGVYTSNSRRGAQMGILDINHPDILEFVKAKRTPGRWNNFNVSVMVTDEFMLAKNGKKPFQLIHEAKPSSMLIDKGAFQREDGMWVYETIDANVLWDTIMQSNYDYAEPGILFRDTINNDNNLRYVERIDATNPCVTIDTWVMTSDGPKQVYDLVNVPYKAIVDGKAYNSEKGFFSTGKKQVVKLKTTGGYYLKLTTNHILYKYEGKVNKQDTYSETPVINLKPGDLLRLNNHSHILNWDGYGTVNDGFLIGTFLLKLPISNKGDGNKVQRILEDLKLDPNSPQILSKLEKTSKSFYIGILNSIFDSFSTVRVIDNELFITVKHEEDLILESVQRMLLRIGIVSVREANTITITNDNIIRFYANIGFTDEIKDAIINNYLKDNISKVRKESYLVDVESITNLTVEPVFDTTVEDIHIFDANGFHAHNCVTGDTLILTDNGYIPIETLVGQEVQIWNGFAWSYVTPMVTGENQEIYDLEFSDGTKLSCTPYHKFVLADNSRIEAKDLQLSDKLAKHRFPIIEGGIRLDNRVAYTQGFYSGDGQAGTNSIWLYNEKCDLLHYLAASAFSDQSTDIVKRFQVSTEFRVESKDFVPDVNFSISTRISWLAGLIDSDGSSQSKTVTIWSVDRNFLNKVKLMMNTLGATGKITLGKRAGMKFMPNSHGGQSLYECQDCWRISISGYYIELLKNLGLRTNRVDISSVVETESNRFIQLTFKHKRIQLEPKVYCFTEELNHTGIFNGIMTAQCGEQPLPPYGCCDLGPINLTKFVMFPFTQEAYFDYDKFKSAVAIQVRFLDNVLDTTLWPLEQQRIEAMNKRRIGLGFTGLGNTLAMMNLHYDSGYGRNLAKNIATCMRDTAYNASIDLAIEKGEFPLLEKEKYLTDTFASRLPDHIKDRIRTYGIRNSHLLSIAPTGTVSLAFCDNASNGIEPPYSLAYTRKKRENDGTMKEYPVIDYGFRLWLETQEPNEAKQILDAVCNYRDHILVGEDNKKVLLKELLPVSLVTALELSVDAHLQMLKVVQPYIDTSISKTTNVPVDYPFEDFKTIYDKAWEYKLKGVATYRPNDILGSVLSVPVETKKEVKVEEPKKDTKPVDPFTVAYPRRPLGDFKSITRKIVYTGATGDVSLFLTVSFIDTYGWTDTDTLIVERPLEVFIVVPPDDVPVEWVTAYAKNLSLIARSSLPLLVKALQDGRSIKSDKGQIRYGWFNKDDGSRAPRFHNSEVGVIAYAIQELLQSKNILDTDGNLLPLNDSNIVNFIASEEPTDSKKEPSKTPEPKSTNGNSVIRTNKVCKHCGASAVIKRDGCSFCTNCNMPGDCG